MITKIAAGLIAFAANLIAAIIALIVLIVALDGQSEDDAIYGFAVFGVLVFFIVFAMVVLAVFIVHFLLEREFKPFSSGSIAVIAAVVVGVVSIAVCIIIGVGVTEYLRINY